MLSQLYPSLFALKRKKEKQINGLREEHLGQSMSHLKVE